ncbi:hypothetical protein [Corynebacterium halotolerans]|uniref:Uncharacterized protein n=1 Tax=Corynebacterium halotolerans YIM 70093 = DSM 44683 TaxID=1121362 RepID=M1NU62_9CORY|nr:hypothetical protein [Corynebacterium halotolerans]AGF73002.1 hypothetical protein A605_10000 [Corynebacterium halotolerans YIM 70093 = DSM 44683]
MGFWTRLLGTSDDAGRIDARAAGTPGPRTGRRIHSGSGADPALNCDPREAAQALHLALTAAEELGFTPVRDILVDDIDFAFYGGAEGFTAERITALLRLEDEEGRSLFPRVFTFESESINSNDAYAHLLRWMAEAAGTGERFEEVYCDLHFGPFFANHPTGELSYLRDGERVEHSIAVEGDFADPDVIRSLLKDATPPGHRWVATNDFSIHAWVPEELAATVERVFVAEDTAAGNRLAATLDQRRRHPGTSPRRG